MALFCRFVRLPAIRFATDATSSSRPMEMTFEDYVRTKRSLKWRKRFAGIPLGVVGLTASSMFHIYWNPHMFDATSMEQIKPIFGIDPLMFASFSGVVSGAIGYVLGGFLYEKTWHIFNKDLARKMNHRNSDFLARIKTHRTADFNKFEDDYYGENVKSLSDYRQWLRIQQRKREESDKLKKSEETEKSVSIDNSSTTNK